MLDQRRPVLNDGFKARQSGDSGTGGHTSSPCEAKQFTSCSVKPGKSTWPRFCLDTPQQSWDMDTWKGLPEATDASLLTHKCTCAQSLPWQNDSLFLAEVIQGTDE